MMKSLFSFLALSLVVLAAGSANADIIFANPIIGANPSNSNPYTTGQIIHSNIQSASLSRGSGVIGATGANRYNASRWNSSSLDLNKYYAFTMKAASNHAINFSSFTYTASGAPRPPQFFEIRTSVDGFTSSVAVPTTLGGGTFSLASPQLQDLQGTVEFRLYAWGAGNAGSTFGINDFVFEGTIYAVPEPSSLALVGMSSVFYFARRRRRQLNS